MSNDYPTGPEQIPLAAGRKRIDTGLPTLELDEKRKQHTHNGGEPGYIDTQDEGELRSLIFSLDDTVEVLLDIPEWHKDGKVVQVLIRALTADERVLYIKVLQQTHIDMRIVYADLAIACARHPLTKKLLFKAADRDAIMKKHGMAIERMAMLAAELSGLSDTAMKGLKKS